MVSEANGTKRVHLVSIIAAVLMVAFVFAAPIVIASSIGDRERAFTLYDALIEFDASGSNAQAALVIATLLIAVSIVLLFAHGFLLIEDRMGIIAGILAIATLVPLTAFHAYSAQRSISILGFEIVTVSMGYGVFVPATIGLLFLIAMRLTGSSRIGG